MRPDPSAGARDADSDVPAPVPLVTAPAVGGWPAEDSLGEHEVRQRAVGGVALLVGRSFGLQVLTFGATVALAHLLRPRDYGLFAVALAVQQVGRSVVELGLPVPLVQRPSPPTAREQQAISTVVLLAGTAVAVASVGVAYVVLPLAGVSSEAANVIAIALLALPLFGMRTVPMVLLERRMLFARFVGVEVTETVAFYAFAVSAAAAGLGVYSLAVAVPVGAGAAAVAATIVQPWHAGFRIDLGAVRPFAAFGVQVSFLYPLQLLRDVGLLAVFSAASGPALAGFYGFGQRLFAVSNAVLPAVQRVGLPALARTEPDRNRARKAARVAATTTLAVAVPTSLVVGAAQPFVAIFFGVRWLPTVDVVTGEALGIVAFTGVGAILTSLALAEARVRGPLLAAAASGLLGIAAAAVLAPSLDALGAGIAGGIAFAGATAVLFALTAPEARASIAAVLRTLLVGVVAVVAGKLIGDGTGFLDLVKSLGAATGTWILLVPLLLRREAMEAYRLLRSTLAIPN